MVDYSWNITGYDYENVDGLTDVIAAVHWTIKADDGVLIGEMPGKTLLYPPNPDSFVSRKNVNEELVKSWLADIVDESALQREALRCLEKKKEFQVS
jgi:hypothetical protein